MIAGRTTPAERQRLCRKRRREGVLLLKVEGKLDLVNALIRRGWLSADAAEDRRVVAEAVEVLIDCWVRGNLSDKAMTVLRTPAAAAESRRNHLMGRPLPKA